MFVYKGNKERIVNLDMNKEIGVTLTCFVKRKNTNAFKEF